MISLTRRIASLVLLAISTSLLVAVLIPACSNRGGWRPGRLTACASNLSQLWKTHANYAIQFGGRKKLYAHGPEWQGGKFWSSLTRTHPPLIDPEQIDILDCPSSSNVPALGQAEYRGPTGDLNDYQLSAPVGADREGAHGADDSGNVLLKKGSVDSYGAKHAVWLRARATTRP